MSIVLFWISLFIVFSWIGATLNVAPEFNNQLTKDKVSQDNFNILSIGSSLTFIFQVMFWSVPASYAIPAFISIFLDVFAIATIFVFVMWIRGVGSIG